VQGDPLVHWTRHYARNYRLQMHLKTGDLDWAEASLLHLENRPTLPKLYRRQP